MSRVAHLAAFLLLLSANLCLAVRAGIGEDAGAAGLQAVQLRLAFPIPTREGAFALPLAAQTEQQRVRSERVELPSLAGRVVEDGLDRWWTFAARGARLPHATYEAELLLRDRKSTV